MPGVRIRASSRRVRAGASPRAARLHVGRGRTGFSTGVGPVSYYTSGRQHTSGGHASRSMQPTSIRITWLVVLVRNRQPLHRAGLEFIFDRFAVDDELDGTGVAEDEEDALLVREGLGLALCEQPVEE